MIIRFDLGHQSDIQQLRYILNLRHRSLFPPLITAVNLNNRWTTLHSSSRRWACLSTLAHSWPFFITHTHTYIYDAGGLYIYTSVMNIFLKRWKCQWSEIVEDDECNVVACFDPPRPWETAIGGKKLPRRVVEINWWNGPSQSWTHGTLKHACI